MGYQEYVLCIFFFLNQSFLLQALYLFKGFFVLVFIANIITMTFPDFVKFQDISSIIFYATGINEPSQSLH